MLRLLLPGVLAGFFFSTTFVFNEMMSAGGGHWFWSASLRYFFMLVFLFAILYVKSGKETLLAVWYLFMQYRWFWVIAGSVGFGFFYALLCYSADHAPGWMLAATWQFTVVAGLFVLRAFGRRFALQVWWYALLVFGGVCCMQYGHAASEHGFDWRGMWLAAAPPLLAGFCYPLGNQLVWEAQNAGKGLWTAIPHIDSPLLQDAFHKVLLMTLGSLPFWLVLGALVQPPVPQTTQVMQAAGVALFAGVVATSLFLYARGRAQTAGEIAAVDATQAMEMLFAWLGGVLFLQSAQPDAFAWLGMAMVAAGLWLFGRQRRTAPAGD